MLFFSLHLVGELDYVLLNKQIVIPRAGGNSSVIFGEFRGRVNLYLFVCFFFAINHAYCRSG